MIYDDFVVQFDRSSEGGYGVRVLRSPMGEAAGHFEPPFAFKDIEVALRDLAMKGTAPIKQNDGTHALYRKLISSTPNPQRVLTPKLLGKALFEALFKGRVGACYERCLGGMIARPGVGLRLVLKINPEDPEQRPLLSIPWEYLYNPADRQFLCLDKRTPLVRYLDVPRAIPLLPMPEALNVLIVEARPTGLIPLQLTQELKNLQQAWPSKRVRLIHVHQPTLARLRRAMLENPFHVLHFMGHGSIDPTTGEGKLSFHSERGGEENISGTELSHYLAEFQSLRLVFLNACESGRDHEHRGDAFSGVASALILKGFPAVLAMQFPISDRAAIAFSKALYERLAQGDMLENAVVEGRLCIRNLNRGGTEWGTPVLFSRHPGLFLFEPTHVQPLAPELQSDQEGGGFHTVYRVAMVVVFSLTLLFLGHASKDALKRWWPQQSEQSQTREVQPKLTEQKVKLVEEPKPGTIHTIMLPGQLPMEFVWIPGGEDILGSPPDEGGRSHVEKRHRVWIKGFWMSRTEVTQAQYAALIAKNPSFFEGPQRPVEGTSFNDATAYATELTLSLKPRFRLPTEAEWEYACRAGSNGPFHGANMAELAWFGRNSRHQTHLVGQKKPNAWGLYDMHGNVAEWCQDWFAPYPTRFTKNPKGPARGSYKVVRGGSFRDASAKCRSAQRMGYAGTSHEPEIGFRLVMEK